MSVLLALWPWMALNGLISAVVSLKNYSLTHPASEHCEDVHHYQYSQGRKCTGIQHISQVQSAPQNRCLGRIERDLFVRMWEDEIIPAEWYTYTKLRYKRKRFLIWLLQLQRNHSTVESIESVCTGSLCSYQANLADTSYKVSLFHNCSQTSHVDNAVCTGLTDR